MLVVTLTEEIGATSQTGPEEAARLAVAQATREMSEVEDVRVKAVEVQFEGGGAVSGYRVTMEVTRGDDAEAPSERGGRTRQTRSTWSRSHPTAPRDESFLELVRQRIILEDLTQEDLDRSDRFLTISPATEGSGSTDVSENHDRHLFDD